MNYTAYNSDLVERKIAEDIASIKDEIFRGRKRWGIISLILYGGFARGEGSVVVEDGDIRSLNDYDFMAVTRHPMPNYRAFRRFVQGVEDGHDGFKADITIRPLWFIKRVRPSIFFYEMKNSGKVVWGEDVLKLMPKIDSNEIPLSSGICTLFNRLMSLMEAYGVEDRKLIVYQCNKAVLTCMEILLLQVKRYHWSYRERLSIFKSIFEKSFADLARDYPEVISMLERATQFKLVPDFGLYPEEDLWEKVAQLYFRILERMEAKKIEKMGVKTIFSRKRRIAYMAGYEWLKAWVRKAPSDKVRKYLSSIDRVEYTDDFLDLKDKIILNWKKPGFIFL